MPRPNFVTDQDIKRWNDILDVEISNEQFITKEMMQLSDFKEACFAGIWLGEELEKLNCPEVLLARIQFTAGKLSFGRDAWEVSMMMLENYKKGEMDIEPENEEQLN